MNLDLMAAERAQIPALMPEMLEKDNEIIDLDVRANAAMKRINEWINRSAGQHKRALKPRNFPQEISNQCHEIGARIDKLGEYAKQI